MFTLHPALALLTLSFIAPAGAALFFTAMPEARGALASTALAAPVR